MLGPRRKTQRVYHSDPSFPDTPARPSMTLPDLTATLEQIRAGRTRAIDEVERALAAAQGPMCRQAFLTLDPQAARAAAADGGA